MATIVQFGAGAIGRGFLAQLWTEAGYEVVFVDVDLPLVQSLNATGKYPLSLVTNTSVEHLMISPVRAVHTDDVEAVIGELASCAYAAVSIGPHVVDTIEKFFVPLMNRQGRSTPLNVVVAENDPEAADTLTHLLQHALPDTADVRVTFVQAIVGRMVPRPDTKGNSLSVVAEPYKHLPLEPGRWQGEFPEVPGMFEQPSFPRYVQKKLYVHNAGHAALAYHGYRKGLEYIWQCAEDTELIAEIRGFWGEVNTFLHDPPLTQEILNTFEDELLIRFQNRVLGDTVARVGRDPIRKLNRHDRLVWPALAYIVEKGELPPLIIRAIAVALHFDCPEDPIAGKLQALIKSEGVAKAFREVADYPEQDPRGLVPAIEEAYNALQQ